MNAHWYKLFTHRTRPIDSSTGWATRWCLNHRVTSGCMVGCLYQKAFWGMFTGTAISKGVFSECHYCRGHHFVSAHVVSPSTLLLARLDILYLSVVGPKCWQVLLKKVLHPALVTIMPLRCLLMNLALGTMVAATASCWWWEVSLKTVWPQTPGVSISAA